MQIKWIYQVPTWPSGICHLAKINMKIKQQLLSDMKAILIIRYPVLWRKLLDIWGHAAFWRILHCAGCTIPDGRAFHSNYWHCILCRGQAWPLPVREAMPPDSWHALTFQLISHVPPNYDTYLLWKVWMCRSLWAGGSQVPFLGQEDPLEKETATQPSILAWKIPCMEEPGGLQSMASQRVR